MAVKRKGHLLRRGPPTGARGRPPVVGAPLRKQQPCLLVDGRFGLRPRNAEDVSGPWRMALPWVSEARASWATAWGLARELCTSIVARASL